MYLLEPICKLENMLMVYNNHIITKEEIKKIILENFEDKQAFIKYNSLKMSRLLKAHPLVLDAQVRTRVFPNKGFNIIINEEKPWALFRNKIYTQDFRMIKDYEFSKQGKDFDSVLELHNSILKNESQVIQIKANKELNSKDFKILKRITDATNERLRMIQDKEIYSVELIDDDLALKNEHLTLIFGNYKKKIKSKIQKLDHLLANIKKYLDEIEYVDLSLDTEEAIIGKKDEQKN